MPPRHGSTRSTTARWPTGKGARPSRKGMWRTTPGCCPCTHARTRRPPNWARQTLRRPSPRARRPSSSTASRRSPSQTPTGARHPRRRPTWHARSSTPTSTTHGFSWPSHNSGAGSLSRRPAPTTTSCASTAHSPTSPAWPRHAWPAAMWRWDGPMTPRTSWER